MAKSESSTRSAHAKSREMAHGAANKPSQRKGAASNAQVGRDFETRCQQFFASQGLDLKPGIEIRIGINEQRPHKFDLGNGQTRVLVECKSHTWREGGRVPSAKLTVWNEAMFFFQMVPPSYRKILFVLRDFSPKKNETLGQYYIRTHGHLIPKKVEIWEFDEKEGTGAKLR